MTVEMQVLISAEEIQTKVQELGQKINAHYANSDKELVLIGLLRGSVLFMADLCRTIQKLFNCYRHILCLFYGGAIYTFRT